MLSVIIPCYNEEESVNKLLENLNLLLKKYPKEELEILIVDNGSIDNTNQLLKKNKLVFEKKIKIIEILKNEGYGSGILKGILESTGKFVAWCHADLQTNPHDVVDIFLKSKHQLLNEFCIIKGKRINRNILDVIFTSGMTLITFLLFRTKLNDINAQPKIFKRNFVEKLDNAPKDFSFDLYFLLLAKKFNYKIYEFPVIWNKRFAGEAKGGGSFKLKIKLTLRTLKFMFKLAKNS